MPVSQLALLVDIRAELNQIPAESVVGLEQLPSAEEIRWVVFALGPTKAPGPDRITASLIQQNWENFGPIVTREVLNFFNTGVISEYVAHSNLVLIPKVSTPTKVADFCLISICNFMYKVISKVIAKRMQPWMSMIISHSQIAFVPGREISENIILLREIIQSFRHQRRREPQFVLKADLTKAFNMVRWEYLFAVLPAYGFPTRFYKWIEACVTSAKFTILFNRSGNGFMKPRRGQRQGCPMSPYLFIIAMDSLSRRIDLGIKRGQISGLKITATTLPMACSMFADDLLLMGSLIDNEV